MAMRLALLAALLAALLPGAAHAQATANRVQVCRRLILTRDNNELVLAVGEHAATARLTPALRAGPGPHWMGAH